MNVSGNNRLLNYLTTEWCPSLHPTIKQKYSHGSGKLMHKRCLELKANASMVAFSMTIEVLKFQTSHYQLKCFGHWVSVSRASLCRGVLGMSNWEGRPQGRPKTCWGDYISCLERECIGVPQGELEEMGGERSLWTLLLRLHPGPGPE